MKSSLRSSTSSVVRFQAAVSWNPSDQLSLDNGTAQPATSINIVWHLMFKSTTLHNVGLVRLGEFYVFNRLFHIRIVI